MESKLAPADRCYRISRKEKGKKWPSIYGNLPKCFAFVRKAWKCIVFYFCHQIRWYGPYGPVWCNNGLDKNYKRSFITTKKVNGQEVCVRLIKIVLLWHGSNLMKPIPYNDIFNHKANNLLTIRYFYEFRNAVCVEFNNISRIKLIWYWNIIFNRWRNMITGLRRKMDSLTSKMCMERGISFSYYTIDGQDNKLI